VIRVINIALLYLITFGPLLLAVLGLEAAGGIFLASLLIVLAAINISADRLEEFTIGPLKAKLREKIREANDLSEQLKNTIRLTLSIAVTAAMRTGRFAFETGKLQKEVYENALEIARSANLTQSDIDSILTAFFKYIEIDMRHIIVGGRIFSDPESERLRKAIEDGETSTSDRPQMMRQLANRQGGDLNEIEEWIRDYEELITKRRLRRPNVWWAHDERRFDDFIIKR